MPVYRIHRLKDAQREHFRRAPHVSGVTSVKAKDYEEAGSIEAPGLYAAWAALRESDRPLGVGDLLETETGDLVICKYVGFEQARWVLPEVKPGLDSTPPGSPTAQSPDDLLKLAEYGETVAPLRRPLPAVAVRYQGSTVFREDQ